MLIVPFVCAEFHDKAGAPIHTIRPVDLKQICEVPDAIAQDPLYAMLVEDGSIRAPETREVLRQLENDPVQKPVKAEEKPDAAPAEAPAEGTAAPAEKTAGRKGTSK